MPDDAEVYQKTPDDKVIILNPRSYLVQGFRAPNWTDLRVGWFLSLTDDTSDDVTSGLAETIVLPDIHLVSPADRYWLGVRNRGNAMPGTDGVSFIGFSNVFPTGRDWRGNTVLSSSDAAIGTTNADFWRPNNAFHPYYSFIMMDTLPRAHGGTASAALAQHFPQSAGAVAAGYAVLLGMRLTRGQPDSRTITAYVKSSGHSADMLYSNTPTKELIRDSMQSWPDSLVIGPASLAHVPDAFYFYWPFRNSRLRIHSVGILQAEA